MNRFKRQNILQTVVTNRYCECFASKLYCDDCNCVGCCNTPENQQLVQKAVSATLERNPKAFKDKIKFATVSSNNCNF